MSEPEIANNMVLGLNTVTTVLGAVYDKLEVTSRVELRDVIA
jgi:DNA-binding NarL/FixJ family response regulator